MDKTKEWQMEMLMEKIRSKAGQYKSFFDSAKALKMTLLEKRYQMDSVERSYLQKCLDTLQQNIKVTTHQAMVERLESVSRQLGLKFVTGPSGLDLFISSDMFYLEVVLDGSGGVKDVKIHHEGRGEQQSCEELVACLTHRDFADFTAQLEGLASIYQLNAEKKIKCKAYSALTSLEADLTTLASLQSSIKDPNALVHKSSVGVLEKRRGGHPMKLTYFVSPYDLLDPIKKISKPLLIEGLNVGYSVSVCMESSTAHKLQTSPLISVTKSPNNKSYAPLTSSNSITVAGCFVLTLNKPMPMCMSLVKTIQNITQCECANVTSPHPILSLITQHASGGQADSANNRGLFVNVGDQHHCYLMTESRSLEGVLVSSVPFTHPSHVPQILTCLRQQAMFNTVISSCVRPNTKQDIEKMTMFEVTPLTWQHLSISLEHPLEESMATVELDLADIMNPTCKVYSSATENGSNNSEYATKIFQRCLSIPVTMRSLIKLWHTQSQRMSGMFNGGGLGNSGSSGGGSSHHSHPGLDFDPDIKIEPGTGLGSLVGRQGSFVTDQSLSDTSFEAFSSQLESGDITIPPGGGTVGSLQFTPINNPGKSISSEVKQGKKRKRRSEDWKSLKRKPGDDFELGLDSSSSDSSPVSTPTSRDASDLRGVTPTSNSGLEFSASSEHENSNLVDKSQSDMETDDVINVPDLEDVEDILKATVKKPKKSRDEKKTATEILFDLENKNLVPPSVSITPISSSQINSQNLTSVLTGMGLERRPGIEIIPIVSTPTTSLPSSITITPISSKSIPDDRMKERKSSKSSKDDKAKLEKKRKRKREDSPMGPPEKVPHKADPLFKPVSVSIKPTDSSSPRSSSPMHKYSSSPTPQHSSPLTIVGKSSPSSSLNKPNKPTQSPKHSPAYPTSSPKNSVPSSPKHGTSSPKHQSSSGKPSMSALKSAVNSPSKSSESKSKSKESRDKERKSYSSSSGHSSPKMKSSSVKLKPLPETGTGDAPQALQSGGSTPPNSGDGGKSSAALVRNRKSSLSAVIDKLKSAQHVGDEGNGKEKKESKERSNSGKLESKSVKPGENKSSEYMVKPSSDGMKLTINKTRTKDSAKMKSSVSGSPKVHTGLKPGVNSGPASKKLLHSGQKQSSLVVKSGSSSSKSLTKSSLGSQKSSSKSLSSSSGGSPKTTSDPNRVRDKPRPPKSDKSIFSLTKGDSKKLSPTPAREDGEAFKLAASTISPQLMVEGFKQLDTKFQIPKLSARNSNTTSQSEEKKSQDKSSDSRLTDSPKLMDLANKEMKFTPGSKNLEDIRVSLVDSKQKISVSSAATISMGNVSPKVSTSKGSGIESESPNISIIPVGPLPEKEEKEKSFASSVVGSSHGGLEDPFSSLKMEPPISAVSFATCDSDKLEEVKKPEKSKPPPTTTQEAAELLLDFSSSSTPKSEANKPLSVSERAIAASLPVRKNTPPPSLPPTPHFPGSPSVSVHIVKSPAPSPLVIRSPPSSSPCITDDELMDEAVVGIGK